MARSGYNDSIPADNSDGSDFSDVGGYLQESADLMGGLTASGMTASEPDED